MSVICRRFRSVRPRVGCLMFLAVFKSPVCGSHSTDHPPCWYSAFIKTIHVVLDTWKAKLNLDGLTLKSFFFFKLLEEPNELIFSLKEGMVGIFLCFQVPLMSLLSVEHLFLRGLYWCKHINVHSPAKR